MDKIVIKKGTKTAKLVQKMADNKKRIREQIRTDKPLSALKDIKFVQPL